MAERDLDHERQDSEHPEHSNHSNQGGGSTGDARRKDPDAKPFQADIGKGGGTQYPKPQGNLDG